MDAGRPQAHAGDREARRHRGGVAVLTAIDHVTLAVRGLQEGIDAFTRIGFAMTVDAERAAAFNDGDYLEIAVLGGEGLRSIALRGDADAPRLEHVTLARRLRTAPASSHPNGVLRLERVYIAVTDVAAAAAVYAKGLGMSVPRIERGTVINADMASFDIGAPGAARGLTLAQPAGPGIAADALASRGPGPFQVLYRTRSMDAAARWMREHGVPPPLRGVRNTGEQAMVVPPPSACGAYIGFVGPA